MYDAPKARLADDDRPVRNSKLRGFAGGWGTLLLGFALAVGWRVFATPFLAVHYDLPFWTVAKLGFIVLFVPVFWLGVHHHRRGARGSAVGVLLALGSLVLLIVLFLAYGAATL